MSDNNDQSSSGSGGGRSLSGGVNEPLPSTWNRPSQPPRVGRVGAWSSSDSSSRYVLLLRSGFVNLIRSHSGDGPRIGRINDLSRGNPVPSRDDDDDDDDKRESWFAGGERRFVVGDQVLVGWC